MPKPLTNILALTIFCAIFYLSSTGCKKTVVQHINNDTTLIRDTTIIVDSTLDKVVQLNFLPANGPWEAMDPTPVYTAMRLYKFNKTNYVGVDSIIFVADPSATSTDATDSAIVWLYDVTDSVSIAGTTLSSNKTTIYDTHNESFNIMQSGNIINALPAKEITLVVAIRCNKTIPQYSPNYVAVDQGYLYLYRK